MPPNSKFAGAMTARQFDAAVKQANVSPLKLARARRVLVDGEAACDVAMSEGVNTEIIYSAIHNFYTPPDRKDRFWPALSPPRD